jgi:multidrug efflux system membrane fusion protein
MPQFTAGTPLAVTASDRANVTTLGTGRVSAVDNQIDTTTGTVKVRAQFDNSDNALFPNQFVNVALLVHTLQNAVTVPTAAIQRGAPGTYVYLVNPDSTVSVRKITVGPTDGSMTAVDSGLSVGDRVVVDGADRLRDGLKVNVTADDHTSAAAAPTAPGAGPPGANAPSPPGNAATPSGADQSPTHRRNRQQNKGAQ